MTLREKHNALGRFKGRDHTFPTEYVSLHKGKGCDLLPPYSVDDIESLERNIGNEIPAEMRTHHSSYRTYVHLKTDGKHIRTIRRTNWDQRTQMRNASDDDPIYDGTIQIGENGCFGAEYLVVCGDDVGLIFREDETTDTGVSENYTTFTP